MQKQKPVKLTESQVKLKKYLKPIVEGILNEKSKLNELEMVPFQPTLVPKLNVILDQYGIFDILYTAKKYYQQEDETTSVKIVDAMINLYKTHYKNISV